MLAYENMKGRGCATEVYFWCSCCLGAGKMACRLTGVHRNQHDWAEWGEPYLTFPKGSQGSVARLAIPSSGCVVPGTPPTSCACLENASALAIMLAVLSSSSPSFCPLSSRAMRARVKSPMTPPAAPRTPSIPPDPGMCWARLREAFPAVASPTAKEKWTNRQE